MPDFIPRNDAEFNTWLLELGIAIHDNAAPPAMMKFGSSGKSVLHDVQQRTEA